MVLWYLLCLLCKRLWVRDSILQKKINEFTESRENHSGKTPLIVKRLHTLHVHNTAPLLFNTWTLPHVFFSLTVLIIIALSKSQFNSCILLSPLLLNLMFTGTFNGTCVVTRDNLRTMQFFITQTIYNFDCLQGNFFLHKIHFNSINTFHCQLFGG